MAEERKTDDRQPDEPSQRTDKASGPGHIPEPRERGWDAEPADPYREIERPDPYQGRPPTQIPRPSENLDDQPPPGPGQPRPRRDEPDDS